MRFEVRINCNNAAFDPDPVDELQRILQRLADELPEHARYDTWQNLCDVNGDIVGQFRIGERGEREERS